MIYLSLSLWFLVVVLTAWGVHQLWSGMLKPKVLNTILLPGTLVAQVGHVFGLLVTGATITNTTLYKDDDSGGPETTTDPKPKIPIVGPVIIGLLPQVACGVAIFFVAREFGGAILSGLTVKAVDVNLPTTVAGMWQLMRDQISLVENIVAVTTAADFSTWRTWLFVYLIICLAIRIAPFPGNLRGALGAIVVLGIGAALVSSLFDVADPRVQQAWAVLNLTVAALLFLLIASLLVRGAVGLVHVLRENA